MSIPTGQTRWLAGAALAALLLAPGAALASLPWEGPVVVLRGSSVRSSSIPPVLPLPGGGAINGLDIFMGFSSLDYEEGDLLFYDHAEGASGILPEEIAEGLTLADALVFDLDGLPVDTNDSELLVDRLEDGRWVVVLGFEYEPFAPVIPGDDGGSGGGGCTGSDSDRDGRVDRCDNCPSVANAGQLDSNGDGLGDACEAGYEWLNTVPATWTASRGEDGYYIAGPLGSSYTNACVAQRALGGRPAFSVDAASFTVALVIVPPPPNACVGIDAAVSALAGSVGDLSDGSWHFVWPEQEVDVPFLVPEPDPLAIQLASLLTLALFAARRQRAFQPCEGRTKMGDDQARSSLGARQSSSAGVR